MPISCRNRSSFFHFSLNMFWISFLLNKYVVGWVWVKWVNMRQWKEKKFGIISFPFQPRREKKRDETLPPSVIQLTLSQLSLKRLNFIPSSCFLSSQFLSFFSLNSFSRQNGKSEKREKWRKKAQKTSFAGDEKSVLAAWGNSDFGINLNSYAEKRWEQKSQQPMNK